MQKLIIVYSAAALGLFSALFAVLALAGIGRPAMQPVDTPSQEAAAPHAPARQTLEFVPPELEAGRTYRISHETTIYSQPDVAAGQRESLPAGGYFTAVFTLTDTSQSWTQITVNNGVRDYSMYMLGSDLRWKTLTPIYSDDEQNDQKFTATLQLLKEASARQRARRAAEVEEEPEIQEAPTFAEWWADRAERMGGSDVANFVVAGLGSAILTAMIIGAIVLLTLLRKEHEWSRPVNPEDDAIDLQAEDDNPFTYSMGGSAYSGHDDEDPRRA